MKEAKKEPKTISPMAMGELVTIENNKDVMVKKSENKLMEERENYEFQEDQDVRGMHIKG